MAVNEAPDDGADLSIQSDNMGDDAVKILFAKLRKCHSMCFKENRVASFVNWPFSERDSCSVEKMAEAGFYHTPSKDEHDVAQCFACLKELSGWEPTDDPMCEHKSHSKDCPFVVLDKPWEEVTVEEFCELLAKRSLFQLKRQMRADLQEVKDHYEYIKEEVQKVANV